MKLSEHQKNTAFYILESAVLYPSIFDREILIAILCVLMKESGLISTREKSYANTSNTRIMKVFGAKKLGKYFVFPWKLTQLKRDPVNFFNWVYRNVAGNRGYASGDGYKYRGGGPNQITGRGNYRSVQEKTGWALEDNPDIILHSECFADVVTLYFNDCYIAMNGAKFWNGKYKNPALMFAANANAGIRKKPNSKVVKTAYENAEFFWDLMSEVYDDWLSENTENNSPW